MRCFCKNAYVDLTIDLIYGILVRVGLQIRTKKVCRNLVYVLLMFAFSLSLWGKTYALGYHKIISNASYSGDFSEEELSLHLRVLSTNNIHFIDADGFLLNTNTHTTNVFVTADDGHNSIYSAYFNVLKPMGIKPMIAIYINFINRGASLSSSQIKTLAEEGCEIASHGFYHIRLSDEAYETNKEGFYKEIFTSKEKLEEITGKPVRFFVYPYGTMGTNAIRMAKEAGYEAAVGVSFGFVTYTDEGKLNNRFALKRGIMVRSQWATELNLIIAEKAEPYIVDFTNY